MNEDTEVPAEAKITSLRQHGALHPQPQEVTDPLFQGNDFFDARDLVQVKYEMLRRVRVDHWSVTAAAQAGGFSRPAFYQAQEAFTQAGLPGLLPKRPGPRRAHKLSEAVVDFLLEQQHNDPPLSPKQLGQGGSPPFSHPSPSTQHRTRSGTPAKKRTSASSASPLKSPADETWQTRYEHLRAQVLQARGACGHDGCGYALLLQRGLAAWMQAWPATLPPIAPPPPEPMSASASAQDPPSLPWSIEQQLAHILADTILDHVQEIAS